MALPWLLGALAVGAVGAIVKAVSEDSDSSSSHSSRADDGAERRRREELEEFRRQEELEAKRKNAREAFDQEGRAIGYGLIDALEGAVVVSANEGGMFKARLTTKGYKLSAPSDYAVGQIGTLLKMSLEGEDIDLFLQNLDFFGAVYDVQMLPAADLDRKLGALNALLQQERELAQLKEEIRELDVLQDVEYC